MASFAVPSSSNPASRRGRGRGRRDEETPWSGPTQDFSAPLSAPHSHAQQTAKRPSNVSSVNVIQRLLGRMGNNNDNTNSRGVSDVVGSLHTSVASSSALIHPNTEGQGKRNGSPAGASRREGEEGEQAGGHGQQFRQSKGAWAGGRGTARKELRRGGGRGGRLRRSNVVAGAETGEEPLLQAEKSCSVSVDGGSHTNNMKLGNDRDSRPDRLTETGGERGEGRRRPEGRGGRQGGRGRGGGHRGHGRGQHERTDDKGDAVAGTVVHGEDGPRSPGPCGEASLSTGTYDEKLSNCGKSSTAEFSSVAFSETSRPSTAVPLSPLDSGSVAATLSTAPVPAGCDDSGARGSRDYGPSVFSSPPPSSCSTCGNTTTASHLASDSNGGKASLSSSCSRLEAQYSAMNDQGKANTGDGGGTRCNRRGSVKQGGSGQEGAGRVAILEDELPIMKYKQVILQHIRDHPVTCIQGETGCGKSTRVPRFLLEEDLEEQQKEKLRMGSPTRREVNHSNRHNTSPLRDPLKETASRAQRRKSLNAIVTQPRRLACIALARRVAQEFDEPLGKSVGFRISGDSCVSKNTKVCFVTTGYFLQILINQPHALSSLTHVILDEVHERDLDADLLSLVLKLQLRHKGGLKLIVMSATLQGNLFAEYFTPYGMPVSPRIYVGARRFPVQHLFLDDLCHGVAKPSTLRGQVLSVRDLTGNSALLIEGRDEEEVEGGDWSSCGGKAGKYQHEGAQRGGGGRGNQGVVGGAGLQVNLVKAMLERKSAREGGVQPQSGSTANGIQFSWKSLKALKDAQSRFDTSSSVSSQGKAGGRRERGGRATATGCSASEGGEIDHLKTLREADGRGWGAEMETSLQPQIPEGLDSVCLDLVTSLGYGGETILIFLPGLGEITDLYETLSRLDSSTAWAALAAADATTTDDPNRKGEYGRCSGSAEGGGAAYGGDEADYYNSSSHRELKYRLFVLHSSISREEQEEVFCAPPSDTVHIVLASNIAESSLTLPAVRIVIDFCLKRQLIYDQRRHTAALVRTWTSHASSQQRSGRTGRVFPGLSIRLVSRQFYEKCMRRFDPPEMQTAPLEKLYLDVKHLADQLNRLALEEQKEQEKKEEERTLPRGGRGCEDTRPQQHKGGPGALMYSHGGPSDFVGGSVAEEEAAAIDQSLSKGQLSPTQLLRLTVQPPDTKALNGARKLLDCVGAITSDSEDAEMTNLGHVMMHLPIDTRLTKLLMFGVVAGCTSDALILTTVLASQDPFTMPSALLIKHPAELSEKLQLSFKSRAAYDANQYSEPIMLRNLFVDWLIEFASSVAATRRRLAKKAASQGNRRLEMNMKSEYARVSREFSRKHSVVAKRMVHMAMMCVDLASRLKRLLPSHSAASANLSFFIDLLQNPAIRLSTSRSSPATAKYEEGAKCPFPSNEREALPTTTTTKVYVHPTALTYNSSVAAAAVQERFTSDMLLLKALLVAAFAPSFVLGKPRVCVHDKVVSDVMPRAPMGEGGQRDGGKGGRGEKTKWDLSDYGAAMLRQGLDPARTLLLHDRLDTRTGLPNKQVRAALALMCAGLDYTVSPCYGAEEKSFLCFPNAPSNACLTFDSRSLAAVVSSLRSSSSRNGENRAVDTSHAAALTNSSNEFRFRTTAEQQNHEERMNRVETVGDHVIVERGGDDEGRRQTMALAVHIPNQFANGRWKLSVVLPGPLSQSSSSAEAGAGVPVPSSPATTSTVAENEGLGNASGFLQGGGGFNLVNCANVQSFDMVRPCTPFLVSWSMFGDNEDCSTAGGEGEGSRTGEGREQGDEDSNSSGANKGGDSEEKGRGGGKGGRKKKKKDEKKNAKKKVVKIKAITNCRNPVGFFAACPVVQEFEGIQRYKQSEEVYGVVTMIQGTDDPSMCWVEGVTILPHKQAVLLLLAFLSQKRGHVELGVQVTPHGGVLLKEVSFYDGSKVLKLPTYGDGPTITLADLSRMNRVRQLLSEVLAVPVSGTYTDTKPTASSSSTCASSSPAYHHQQYGISAEHNQTNFGPYSASHQQNTTPDSAQYRQPNISQGGQYNYQHPRTPGETVNVGAVNAESGNPCSFSKHHQPTPTTSGVGVNPSPRGGGQRFGNEQGRRGVSKGGEDDHKKVNIDESAEIHDALVQMLQRCNEDVDNHELEQSQRECKVLVLASPLGRGSRIPSRYGMKPVIVRVCSQGLSQVFCAPGSLNIDPSIEGAMKTDFALCRLPAFEEGPLPGRLLSPFNLRGIALKVEETKKKAMQLQARARAREEEARRAAAKRLLASHRQKTTQTNKGSTRQGNNPGGDRGAISFPNQRRRGGGNGGAGPDLSSYTGMHLDAPPSGGKRGGRGKGKGKNVAGVPAPMIRSDDFQGRQRRAAARQQPPLAGLDDFATAGNPAGTYHATGDSAKRTPPMEWFGYRGDGLAPVVERAYGNDRPEYAAGFAYQPHQSPPTQQYMHLRERLVTPVKADVTNLRPAYGMTGVPFAAQATNQVLDAGVAPNIRMQRYGAYQPAAAVSAHPHTSPISPGTPSYPYQNPSQILASLSYGFNGNREAPPTHGPTNCLPHYRPPQSFIRHTPTDVPAAFSDADRARAILQNLQNLQNVRRFEGAGAYQ
ncbi:helicase associated domain protein [Cystoisospora suis]|uniref:Helicase associated domain protein n=1 Tax=Cystoisospora suis TaxID=483139 RepID=A0A2C6KRN8_9APIC|nr:helicase associated domain protein [Cystoisospora suis]